MIFPLLCKAQVTKDRYRLFLTDKQSNIFTVDKPEDFLSDKALERRYNQDIQITESDLPVSKIYLDSLKNLGFKVITTSKWLNTVIVESKDHDLLDTIENYDFIRTKYKKLNYKIKENSIINLRINHSYESQNHENQFYDYGYGTTQISMLKGHVLHQNGYQGQGITIAVIDGGFYNVDLLPSFDSIRINNQILGTKDFVDNDIEVYDASSHGMKVLSTMGSLIPGKFVGTAPKANYWLIRSEKADDEYTIEEDYWLAAAEFADSVGANIINTSLGYSEFDDPAQSYTYSNLDGNTTIVTQAADIAASKGMLVVTSAGNLGNDPWLYISAPADGDSVLAVGAVDAFANYAGFSGIGPTYDGRIKPNVCAMGYQTTIQGADGSISSSNGTSFSAPLISGLAACLWQAFPELNNMEILKKIEESSHIYSSPNNKIGYGIPDFAKAANIAELSTNNPNVLIYKTYPNPVKDFITIEFNNLINSDINVKIINAVGSVIKNIRFQDFLNTEIHIDNLDTIPNGIYYIKINSKQLNLTTTFSKID